MENLKEKILDVLNKNAETAHYAGSCGELGDSFTAINSEYFSIVAEEIINFLKSEQKLILEENDFDSTVEEKQFKSERDRIFRELFDVLPKDDKGDVELGDEIWHIIYNKEMPKQIK
ncbi:hypothetical protein [uncultured Chryseobacterium sp.]|uniref:hypothetical protein n=1 Tax=uncultured Chryseobacterium sp. TaxID=259322 RepID=UPI0025EC7B3E|nr:hypothetical protein [uncultured Chryseobacterium sp.]